MSGVGLLVGAMLLVFFVIFFSVSSSTLRVQGLVATAVALILSGSSVLLPEDSSISIGLRMAGVLTLLVAQLAGQAGTQCRVAEVRWPLAFIVPLAGFVTVATLPHDLAEDLFLYGSSLIVLALFLYGSSRINKRLVGLGTALALALLLVVSLGMGVIDPGLGIENGRLRGYFENANSLGFVAFLAISAGALLRLSLGFRLFLFLAAGVALVLSASRASLLASAVVLCGLLITRRPVLGVLALILVVVSGERALAAVSGISPEFGTLFRENNSRLGSFDTALIDWQASPVFGVGLNRESSIIASSPLRALAQGGALGAAMISVMCIALLVLSLRAQKRAFWFTLAAVVHSFFEGWMLSPGAPLLMIFAILWSVFYDPEGRTVSCHGGRNASKIVRFDRHAEQRR